MCLDVWLTLLGIIGMKPKKRFQLSFDIKGLCSFQNKKQQFFFNSNTDIVNKQKQNVFYSAATYALNWAIQLFSRSCCVNNFMPIGGMSNRATSNENRNSKSEHRQSAQIAHTIGIHLFVCLPPACTQSNVKHFFSELNLFLVYPRFIVDFVDFAALFISNRVIFVI